MTALRVRVRFLAAPGLLVCALAAPAFADDPPSGTLSLADSAVLAGADSAVLAGAGSAKKSGSELADTVHYESDFIDYDNEQRILQLFGRARVKYQNITLLADTIVYTVENDQFQARGKPTLIEGNDTTVGDFMVYNIKTKRGRVSYASTRFDETYVTGSNIIKTPDNCLYIEQGDYTSCENPEHPHYFFYGRHIKFIPDDKVITRPVVFNVGGAPVAALPFFIMPMQKGRRSGWLTPSWGGSVSRGGYIDNLGYYIAPNDYYDLTLRTKVQEFNSFVFNAAGRYTLRYSLDGQVSGRYVIDNRLEQSSQQWALDYRHNHLLTPDGKTRMSGQGSVLSTRTFNQLYSDRTYELEQQQLDANMTLSHRFDKINASANLMWRRNHNLSTDRIEEDMPSVDFNLQNRAFIPFKTGAGKDEPSWYNNIYYSYNTKAKVRREAYGNDSLPGFIKSGMEHNVRLTSSQKILKYVDLSPYFNINTSMFQGAIDTTVIDTLYLRDTLVYNVKDPESDTRAPEYTLISATPMDSVNRYGELVSYYRIVKISPVRRHLVRDTLGGLHTVSSWSTGVNMSTRIYGLFPMGGLMGVTAIRHMMTPTVGYAFVPEHELDKRFYNVGINYERARPKAQQLVNFSLSNTFQGKRVVTPKESKSGGSGRTRGSTKTGSVDDYKVSVIEETHSVINENESVSPLPAKTPAGVLPSPDDSTAQTASTGTAAAVAAAGTISAPDTAAAAGAVTADTAGTKPASKKQEQKFDLLTLTVNTSYDFEAEERRWRDISLSASTNVSILSVRYSSNFWLYNANNELKMPVQRDYSIDLTSGRLGASGKLWDGDLLNLDLTTPDAPVLRDKAGATAWDVSFSPSFSYRAQRALPGDKFLPTKSFNVSSSAGMNLTNAMSVKWSGNYDFSSSQFSHNNFTFYYDLECWEMRFTWRPEKINPGFHFIVNVKKIPDIKWEEKESRTTRVL